MYLHFLTLDLLTSAMSRDEFGLLDLVPRKNELIDRYMYILT
jgi:hypothetical protein